MKQSVLQHLLFVLFLSVNPAPGSGQDQLGQTAAITQVQVSREPVPAQHLGRNLIQEKSWSPVGDGFVRELSSFVCENLSDQTQGHGFSQTVVLDQERPALIVATLESKSQAVSGDADNDYSVYLDLTLADGSHLWGQAAPFDVGNHDWQTRQVTIFPRKSVKSVSYFGLFRGHVGKAWFRKPKLTMQSLPRGWHQFDGQAFVLNDSAREGIQVRDAASGGPFVHLRQEALGLRLKVRKTLQSDAAFFDVEVRDISGRDRAITLAYSFPVAGDNLWWLSDPRSREKVEPNSEYATTNRFPEVGSERLSRYPFAAVANDQQGSAVGIDMARPAFYRLLYVSATKELLLLFDLGFTAEKPTATLRFCRYTFDPSWGFRAALDRYYQLFPGAFKTRAKRQGNWMPFAKISELEGWEDFGFAFKEGNNETLWDDAHGIRTFRYTEPMTWWMKMPPEMPRTHEAAIAEAKRLAQQGDRHAQALLGSGFHDQQGNLTGLMRNTPWTNGIVWSMNSMPGVNAEVTDFSFKWNPELIRTLYGGSSKGQLDGEYFDSSEGYVTAPLDFRRENIAIAQTPLCFSSQTKRPGIFRGQVAFEYMRAIADQLHDQKRLTMANSTPTRICWYAPLLDVMGSETDWNRNDQWTPMTDADLLYRRVMCRGKPYCFLMNTDFQEFSHAKVEKYMQRCLAYGMFPGFFSHNASEDHYFKSPELYQRDRVLFKKYVPLCKRVAEATWEPITRATSDNPHVHLERFGKRYLTVFNDNDQQQTVNIRIAGTPTDSQELLSNQSVVWTNRKTTLTLSGESVAVIQLTREP